MDKKLPPRSYLSTIVNIKCPRCREGDLFKQGNLYGNYSNMKESCDKCGVSFQQEPGFYYGAMYVSYGFAVALFVPAFLLTQVVFQLPWWVFLGGYALTMAILTPIIFRLSRVTYLSFFVLYHDDAIDKFEKEKGSTAQEVTDTQHGQ